VSPFTPISLFRLGLAQDRNPLAQIPVARNTPEGGHFAAAFRLGLAQDGNRSHTQKQDLRAQILLARTFESDRYAGAGARIPVARKTPEAARFAAATR